MGDRLMISIIPVLLSAILSLLGWMGISLNHISESLAIAVTKIDDHEYRLNSLEDWRHGETDRTPPQQVKRR